VWPVFGRTSGSSDTGDFPITQFAFAGAGPPA